MTAPAQPAAPADNNEEKLPEILYHYTTLEGFKEIIESGELHASNIQYMNDKSEYRGGINIARKIYEDNNLRWPDDITSKFEDDTYVASFTKACDDLVQWRSYCGNFGVNIGFSFDTPTRDTAYHLSTLPHPLDRYNVIQNYARCIYSEQTFEESIQRLIDESRDMIENGDMSFVATVTLDYLCAYKNRHFSNENEWRFFFTYSGHSPDVIGFHRKTSLLVPHYRIPITNIGHNHNEQRKFHTKAIIREINIGPCIESVLSQKSIEKYLQCKNISGVNVKSSDIPYRNYL